MSRAERARAASAEARAASAEARAEAAERGRVEERALPGWRFGYALSLFAELVPVRAGYVTRGADGGWAARFSAMRSLSALLVPDCSVLHGREAFVDAARRAEVLERRLFGLQEQVKVNTSVADARDACRAELLFALRAAMRLGIDKWAEQARGRAAQLEHSLQKCGFTASSMHHSGTDAEGFTSARAALNAALEDAARWERRHDPRAWAAASDKRLVAFHAAAAAQGGLVELTDPTRLVSLLGYIDAMCSALTEEKTRLETDNPCADVPWASADFAIKRVRDYVTTAVGVVAELTATFKRLVEQLTFYSHGESRPDPTVQLKRWLDDLHMLEDKRDEKSFELSQVEKMIKRSAEVSPELSERKAKLEAELVELSKSLSRRDRGATVERARLVRHAEEHFPELCCDRAWLVQIGLGDTLAGNLELARSGVLLSGARFSDYALSETLQEAGGKAVYRVKDEEGRDMVVKRFPLGSADAQRHFLRQAGLLRSLNRSNLVAVEGVFVQEQFGYLVMPFYASGDLAAWLAARPPAARSLEQCMQIARDVVNGLRGLHAVGVVHCDIKPSNVLLTRGGQALIGDFDGARQVAVTMTRAGDLQVTQTYLAPEFQSGAAKEATAAMDVFALGRLFGELFEGARIGSPGRALLSKMVDEDPLKRPTVEAVAGDAFFDARPVELRDCGSCYDKRRLEGGLECADKHFLCKDCLESGLCAYLKPDSDRDPRVGRDLSVGCLYDPACGARLAARDLARHVSEATLAKVRKREHSRLVAEVQQELGREYERRLKAELARKVDDVIFTRHREHICGLLTPSCPRCKRVFFDFDGCFAISCSGQGGCGCAFCAYCLEDCGADAHHHVAACPHRPHRAPSVDGVYDRYYGSKAEFEAAMKTLRTRRVREYWSSEVAKLPGDQRQKLATCIRPLLKDMTEPALVAEL